MYEVGGYIWAIFDELCWYTGEFRRGKEFCADRKSGEVFIVLNELKFSRF